MSNNLRPVGKTTPLHLPAIPPQASGDEIPPSSSRGIKHECRGARFPPSVGSNANVSAPVPSAQLRNQPLASPHPLPLFPCSQCQRSGRAGVRANPGSTHARSKKGNGSPLRVNGEKDLMQAPPLDLGVGTPPALVAEEDPTPKSSGGACMPSMSPLTPWRESIAFF